MPGDARLQAHTVQKVIVTQTDRDFVDLTVKKLATRLAQAAAGVALAAAVVLGASGPASAAPTYGSTLTTTYHHPFYDVTQSAFVDAVDLHIGDELQTADGDADGCPVDGVPHALHFVVLPPTDDLEKFKTGITLTEHEIVWADDRLLAT